MRKLLLSLLMFVGLAGTAHAQFCPGVTPWVFDDVQASDPFCGAVTWAATSNVTLGCQIIDGGHRLYCPNDLVTRKQMAVFMQRLSDHVAPLTCASGQVMKWNGLAWVCANDNVGGSGGGGTVTSVATSAGLTGGPITTIGTIGLAATQLLPTTACANDQVAKWNGAAWACGSDNTLPAGSAFLQNGNSFSSTAVLGTNDDNALELRVNSTRIVRYEPNVISPNVIAGHPINYVAAGVRGATIAGGGVPPAGEPAYNFEGPNRVTAIYGTVSGGYNNQAGNTVGPVINGAMATVGGGFGNVAEGFASTIAGGDLSLAPGNWAVVGGGINNLSSGFQASTVAGGAGNHAIETFTTVGGGRNNEATASYATVPGGQLNIASGTFSLAAGRRAKTQTADVIPIVHNGTFVWADSSDFDFNSTAANEFAARATGGVRLVLGVDGITGAPTWTCSVVSGGSWACSSDRNLKQNLHKLDGQEVLGRLAAMPIYAWNPKGQNARQLHYGPTAQDFHAAFGLGDSPLRIGQQDADGVALAAIQGVNEKLDQREAMLRREIEARTAEVAELRRQIAELRTTQNAEVAELRRAVEILMARTSAEGTLARSQ